MQLLILLLFATCLSRTLKPASHWPYFGSSSSFGIIQWKAEMPARLDTPGKVMVQSNAGHLCMLLGYLNMTCMHVQPAIMAGAMQSIQTDVQHSVLFWNICGKQML